MELVTATDKYGKDIVIKKGYAVLDKAGLEEQIKNSWEAKLLAAGYKADK